VTGLGLMRRAMLVFWGLPGAVLYLCTRRHPRRGELEQTLQTVDGEPPPANGEPPENTPPS